MSQSYSACFLEAAASAIAFVLIELEDECDDDFLDIPEKLSLSVVADVVFAFFIAVCAYSRLDLLDCRIPSASSRLSPHLS